MGLELHANKAKTSREIKMARVGQVSGEVKGRLDFMNQCNFRQGASGLGGPQVVKDSQIWYCDSNKADPAASGDGLSWAQAFITLNEGIAAAGDGDIIYVAAGDYTSATTLAITQENLVIIGANRSENDYKTMVYTSAAVDIMSVDANNVGIFGLGLSAVGGAGSGIVVGETTGSYKLHVENCRFDGWSAGTYGIKTDDTTDSPDMTVQNCLFRSWQTGGIHSNVTRGVVRDCIFLVPTGAYGVSEIQTGANRPHNLVMDNTFVGVGTCTGIVVAAVTIGYIGLFRNNFANFSTEITSVAKENGAVNYMDDTAGGALVDLGN